MDESSESGCMITAIAFWRFAPGSDCSEPLPHKLLDLEWLPSTIGPPDLTTESLDDRSQRWRVQFTGQRSIRRVGRTVGNAFVIRVHAFKRALPVRVQLRSMALPGPERISPSGEAGTTETTHPR